MLGIFNLHESMFAIGKKINLHASLLHSSGSLLRQFPFDIIFLMEKLLCDFCVSIGLALVAFYSHNS